MPDKVRKLFIEKYYGGDAKAYDDNMASHDIEADARYLKFGKDPATHWSDIEVHVRCYPEHEDVAVEWIRLGLGYIPQPHTYMPVLAFLQTLVEYDQTGKISDDEFFDELIFYLKRIRNADIKTGGWLLHEIHTKDDHKIYNNHLAVYKEQARARLSKFLDYEPLLEHSLDAEIFLRQLFELDNFYTGMAYCDADYKAATIVAYRETFLKYGETLADASDLIRHPNDRGAITHSQFSFHK